MGNPIAGSSEITLNDSDNSMDTYFPLKKGKAKVVQFAEDEELLRIKITDL
jgi:hypothetical protein